MSISWVRSLNPEGPFVVALVLAALSGSLVGFVVGIVLC